MAMRTLPFAWDAATPGKMSGRVVLLSVRATVGPQLEMPLPADPVARR